MPYHRVLRLVLLMLCGILVPAVLAGKELCLRLKPKSMGGSSTNLPLLSSHTSSPSPKNGHKYLLNYS